MNNPPCKAAFFDRDGTLIEAMPFLDRTQDVILRPGIIPLCRWLQQQGYLLFVVTNQSGIARGFFDHEAVHAVHAHIQELLTPHQITIAGWYYCPHHPFQARVAAYAGICQCRKPAPGMLLQAQREHGLDLTRSLMFGDLPTDLEAGQAAGCTAYSIDLVLADVPGFITYLATSQKDTDESTNQSKCSSNYF